MTKPRPDMVKRWREGIANNDASGNLVSMSRWFSNNVVVAYAWKSDRQTITPEDVATARAFSTIFRHINAMHAELGHLPEALYNFRAAAIDDFLRFVRRLDADTFNAFNGCL